MLGSDTTLYWINMMIPFPAVRNMNDFKKEYLKCVLVNFQNLKELGEKAFDQVSDEHFFAVLDPLDNSIAILVKHISGNLRSRWTDFLESDGEKSDRHRDAEFEIRPGTSRSEIMKGWEAGWSILFNTINSLRPQDLDLKVRIRGRPYTVADAINRQIIHYAYHVGQIVMLAKHFASEEWVTLSIPRGQSEEYNTRMAEKWEDNRDFNR